MLALFRRPPPSPPGRPFTSWWNKFVDGVNPDDSIMGEVSQFFRWQKIDPYRLEKTMMLDYKRWFLIKLEFEKRRGRTPEEKRLKAHLALATERKLELKRLRGQVPYYGERVPSPMCPVPIAVVEQSPNPSIVVTQ